MQTMMKPQKTGYEVRDTQADEAASQKLFQHCFSSSATVRPHGVCLRPAGELATGVHTALAREAKPLPEISSMKM